MPIAEFVTLLTVLCSNGDFACYDYYNNCVISKSLVPTMKLVSECKLDYERGVERIKKLQEDK
jgi:hypothetical protein